MGPLDLLNQLLNFVAPALFVGIFIGVLARLFMRRSPAGTRLCKQMAINAGAGIAALFAGLVYFGHDGKMASYAALIICCATSQWALLRCWRK